MVNGNQKRTRSERVAALELPPGMLERTFEYLKRGDVLLRLGLCLLTALLLWAVTGGWAPPFSFRKGYTPPRDITAKIAFSKPDPESTREARKQAGRTVRFVYEQDKEPLAQLRAALKNRAVQLAGAKSLMELDPDLRLEFFPMPASKEPLAPEQQAEQEKQFQRFRDALADKSALARFEQGLAEALAPFERRGLMEKLAQEPNEGNQLEIVVHPTGQPKQAETVRVSDVLIGEGDAIKRSLLRHLDSTDVANKVFDWLRPRLPTTLTPNKVETNAARDAAMAEVGEKFIHFEPGDTLAPASKPLSAEDLALLELEHQNILSKLTWSRKASHSLATLGMFVALSTLCGVYVLCYERKLLQSLRRFSTMLALVVVTVALALLGSRDTWRAESIPLLLFGMTVAIAYHQELALLVSAAVGMVIVVAIGQGFEEFIILMSAVATAILLVGRIRSRRKLIYVGLTVGLVAFLTTVGVCTLAEQPLEGILPEAARFGLWAVVAGFLMTGLLPFIENLFSVQTDISLLELGDVAHPLLQELVRRAPGTYNHSINVASLAEAAADSIGARGILVRVGAYFHDIGKMLKPGYFVENQGHNGNRHESLLPAMSTLIIIAHIKDGADLARQHHLPESIIDFIQQHHGTTLVEYFYRRANEQSEANPDGGEVEESAFRYPGPKPQTREAAVLMVADAVESACRALVEPTPARIEGLVHDIALKRLLDGQFDQCSLTLKELATVEDTLIKSLTAVYHGRVKYPGQRTA